MEYGLWFLTISVAYMVGNFLSGRYTIKFGLDRMILAGCVVTVCGGFLCLAAAISGLLSPLTLFLPMSLAAFGNGLTIPNGTAGAITSVPLTGRQPLVRSPMASRRRLAARGLDPTIALSRLLFRRRRVFSVSYSWLPARLDGGKTWTRRTEITPGPAQAPTRNPKERITSGRRRIGEGHCSYPTPAPWLKRAALRNRGNRFHPVRRYALQALVLRRRHPNAVADALEFHLQGQVRAEGDLDFRALSVSTAKPPGLPTSAVLFVSKAMSAPSSAPPCSNSPNATAWFTRPCATPRPSPWA